MAGQRHLPVTGGCHCGAVRFRLSEEPAWSSYCHCRDCRKIGGAPLTAFVGLRDSALTFEGPGEPRLYHSSSGVARSFCPDCGSPITYQDQGLPGMVYLLIGSLDHPEDFPPTHHAWETQRLPWIEVLDDLPRRPGTTAPRTKGET